MPIIPALGRQRQEDLCELEASLVYKSQFQDRLQCCTENPVSKNQIIIITITKTQSFPACIHRYAHTNLQASLDHLQAYAVSSPIFPPISHCCSFSIHAIIIVMS